MQDLHGEAGMLTILDKFAKVQEGALCGLGDLANQRNDGIHNRLFEIESALFSQKVGHEADQDTVLRWVSEAQLLKTSNDGDLEFVGNFSQKSRNLFQETIDRVLRTSFEQSGNGEGRDGERNDGEGGKGSHNGRVNGWAVI